MALKADGNGGFVDATEKGDKPEDKPIEAAAKGDEKPGVKVDKAAQVQMLVATAEHLLVIAKEVDGGADLPENFTKEFGSMAESITKAESLEAPKRVSQMGDAVKMLEGVIGELRSTDKTESKPAATEGGDKDAAEKSEALKKLEAENAALQKKLEKLETPRDSNSAAVDDAAVTTEKSTEPMWPSDMGAKNRPHLAG